ncbi:hypothetical protein CMO90_02390 [Candidatus Woesearchaeota archaeon]|jgi:hypothetical protein|nr:hypothetical protein [Candidatus Woesearchaeota archaeon]|tara:strand:+ start:480 stop:1073 length:594 start_codon:yes stop_codon:yes gene_type:complete
MAKLFRLGDTRDILVAKWELEYEDIYHFKNLYKLAHEFLVEKGWEDPEGGENWEYFYNEKILPHGGKEYRIWWRLQQIPQNNSYVRYLLKIDYLGINMNTAEVMYKDKKYKTWKGDLIIFCEAWLQLDYGNKWRKNRFLKLFDEFFRDRIYKPYWEAHKLELYKKCYEFNRELKKFLKLKTPIKEPKQFRGEKGVPS